MLNVLAVAAGGALGAAARYGLSGLARRWSESGLPLGTLLVNLLGCLLIGLLVPWLLEGRLLVRPEVRAFVLIGLLGGLTTFSTFGYEVFAMINEGQWGRAGWTVLLNNGLGIALVLVGYRIGTWLVRAALA